MSKQTYVPILLKLFRQLGYEGVTLSKISQATGLGKASLYHHFPGGKAEMAAAALTEVNVWLETCLSPILDAKTEPIAKFELMCVEVDRFFDTGKNSCLWAVFILERSSEELFGKQIQGAFSQWIEAISSVLSGAGLDKTLATQRGEDAIIAIQGALILSYGLKDVAPFQRVLKQLPAQLCRDLDPEL